MAERKPQTERRQVSRMAILDAAEHLFAVHGRDGVTVRAIADRAGVDAALIRYYFGDKEAVFIEMFERRATVLNQERHAILDRYEVECGENFSIGGALDAFLRPMFEAGFNRGEGWADFAAIAALANASRANGTTVMSSNFDAIVGRFLGYLRAVAPELPEASIYWFFNHLTGALTYTVAQTRRIDHLSGGTVRADQMRPALGTMIAVFSAGFEALRRSPIED